MSRPVIGLTTAVEQARWTVWDVPATVLPLNYVESVQRAGGLALLLPPDANAETDPDEILDLLDGLILTGGSDLDPAGYGAETDPAVGHVTPERDAFEVALARRAMDRDLPFLGICRGMQIMNVARGGDLIQHLPDRLGTTHHLRRAGTFVGAGHDVRLLDGSLAARAAGEVLHHTLSHHHQAIDRVGEGLAVTGWSTEDALPEAIEAPDARFALGVQWHPEADETSRLVAALVAEAAGRATSG